MACGHLALVTTRSVVGGAATDDSRDGGLANWCKFACEAELVGFGAVVDGSLLSAEAEEEVAAVGLAPARVAGRGTSSTLVKACVAKDTASGLISSVWRLRGRDLRGFGDFCAGAMVVEEETEATLVCDAVGASREGVVGRGFSDFFGAVPGLSGY